MSKAVGMVTACVLWVSLGDPIQLPLWRSVSQSDGPELEGAQQRQTPRQVEDHQAWARPSCVVGCTWRRCGWCKRRRSRSGTRRKRCGTKAAAKGALVGVMRKLALALHATGARGETFDPERLFPGKPLAKPSGECRGAGGGGLSR